MNVSECILGIRRTFLLLTLAGATAVGQPDPLPRGDGASVEFGGGAASEHSGPAAWWRFDEGAGNAVKDASGHGLEGVVHGSTKWVPGVSGTALALDGSAYVEIPFDRQWVPAGGFTIQAFIRPTDYGPSTYKHVLEFGDSCLLRLDNPPEGGQLSFFTFLSGQPEPRLQAGVPEIGKWHQVLAVWDGRKMQLWLDGVKRERDRPGRLTPTETPLRIGHHFVGAIDEVKFYPRALTENEIWSLIPPKPSLTLKVPHPLLEIGRPFTIICDVANVGGQSLAEGAVALAVPPGLVLVEGAPRVTLPAVTRITPQTLRWTVRADAALAAEVMVKAEFKGAELVAKSARCVVARPIPSGGSLLQQATLTAAEGDLVLGNQHLRLVFPTNDFGYGVFAIDLNQGGRWTRMGLANCFSYLAVNHAQASARQFVYARAYRPLAAGPGQAGIEFHSQIADGAGARWDWRFRFRLTDDDRVKIEQEAVPDQDGSLILLQGPTLHVGEGTFGTHKDDALFCGLEWLVGEERSSSDLDLHDPNHYVRFAPHPNKITVPLMALAKDGAALALYWDCLQRWDGTNTRPAAVFAAPNFIEAQENHLMGLFLPSVPEWVDENHLEASQRPYPFKRQVPLRLECWIAGVTPASQSVDCLPRWFQTFGVPEPAPYPRGDPIREVEFSMRAFLESLWVEAEQKWWTSKGGGELMSQKGLPPAFAYQLRMAASLTADATLQAKFAERAALAETLGAFRPEWDDVGFTWGSPSVSLAALGRRSTGLVDSMGEDGAWRFRTRVETQGVFKGMDYASLGPDRAAEVGTCARNTYDVLRFARMTGDAELFRSGQKSLEFMKRFTVPRAAQVWECPVHSPDILAAADAIEAYLEAYGYSADPSDRDEAIRWAWRGLPFVYVWNPPDRERLRYASIAIYGGSWYGGSWIGQPVQWNGLRYAYALLKLAECDTRFPWRKIAEGLTVSAMYQQDAQGPNVALWPDNFSAIDWSNCPWVFEPGAILKNVFKLIGHDIEPGTTFVGTGTNRLVVTGRAIISAASWNEGVLRFNAQFPESDGGYLLIAGVEKPSRVRLDATVVAEVPGDLAKAGSQGWKHESEPGWLLLKLVAAGPNRLEVDGARSRPSPLVPRVAEAIAFDFDQGLEGWIAASQIEDLRVENGTLTGHATGGDPYLHRVRLKVNGDRCPAVRVRARATSGQGIALFWVTEDSPEWAENKAIHLGFTPGPGFREHLFDVGKHPLWSGKTITGIRLDPIEGGSGGDFEIDYVRGSGP